MSINREALIASVQKRRSLWALNDPTYSKKRNRLEMWRSVAMEVCHNIEPTTVTAVKETWNNLVTVFRRRVNEIKDSKNPGLEPPPKWKYFKQLLFLAVNYDVDLNLLAQLANCDGCTFNETGSISSNQDPRDTLDIIFEEAVCPDYSTPITKKPPKRQLNHSNEVEENGTNKYLDDNSRIVYCSQTESMKRFCESNDMVLSQFSPVDILELQHAMTNQVLSIVNKQFKFADT